VFEKLKNIVAVVLIESRFKWWRIVVKKTQSWIFVAVGNFMCAIVSLLSWVLHNISHDGPDRWECPIKSLFITIFSLLDELSEYAHLITAVLTFFDLLLSEIKSQLFCHVSIIHFWASFIRSLVGILFMRSVVADVTASYALASAFSFYGIPAWDGYNNCIRIFQKNRFS